MLGCASVKRDSNLRQASGDSIEDARAEVTKLLESIDMENLLQQSIEQMLQLQLEQKPEMLPYKKVMMAFMSKHMSYESLKDDFIAMYVETFTVQELRDINQFYQTSTGKKTIKVMPELMAKGAQLGASRVQQNSAELIRMITQETERLKKLQGS
jgi:hypothetical protein